MGGGQRWASPCDLTVAETTEAIGFLIAQSLAANVPIDLRLADKTYGDFWAYKHKKTKSHWHVLVVSEIQQNIIAATAKKSNEVETRDERLKKERAIVRNSDQGSRLPKRAGQVVD